MSVDTFNDVLDTARAELNDELSLSSVDNSETSTGPATLQLDPFGQSGANFDFDFTFTPPAAHHPDEGGDSGEKTPGASSVDLAPLADGDQTLSSLPDSSTPSDHSFLPFDSTPPSSVTSHSQDPCSDINQSELLWALANSEAKDVGIDDTEDEYSSEEPSTDLSGEDPRLFDPHTACRELTQPRSAPAGWTYRQILEVVALPPPEGLHLWHTKISQLAAELGMPSWSTGRDIVTFVLHVASVKNELGKVVPLIKALAATARVLEGRNVAPTALLLVIFALYPGIVPLCSTEPVQAETKTARKRSHDEMMSESEPGEEENDREYDGDDDAADGTDDNEPTSRRAWFEEEDLYCRIGYCLWAFKEPRMCMKHRNRHFTVRWVCPGPCKGESAQEGAKFTRGETFQRHLMFQKNAACMKAVLDVLGLETIPGSGCAWLVPFRDGPERPWESPDIQLTDLSIVKEWKMMFRSSVSPEPSITPTKRRRCK